MLMYDSSTHEFKENVPVVYALQKTGNILFFIIIFFFALSINIKNRRK